jgi:hypothetical protein
MAMQPDIVITRATTITINARMTALLLFGMDMVERWFLGCLPPIVISIDMISDSENNMLSEKFPVMELIELLAGPCWAGK